MKFLDKLAWYLPLSGKTSQAYEGEDILLWRLFTEEIPIKNGFYIDVGAFHPRQYSNTWLLRKRLGFRGINIEPSDRGIKQFNRWRKNDININGMCWSEDAVLAYYYREDDPALSGNYPDNTICFYDTKDRPFNYKRAYTLKTICEDYSVKTITLLSIDVEGRELDVLKGHDWGIKPKVIICEINDKETHPYILKKGYKLYAKTKRNGIYVA